MFKLLFAAGLVLLAAAPTPKKLLSWSPPPSTDDDRPVVASAMVTAQGSDYVVTLQFDKAPYGDGCKTRCANATLFIDTDNSKDTGLKLADAKAAETGADISVTIQGVRSLRDETSEPELKVVIKQFNEDATGLDQGNVLAELDARRDRERLTVDGTTVSVLVDANLGNQPAAAKLRAMYHPPDHAAMVGVGPGLAAGGGRKIEVFKGNKLSNPSKATPKER